ncbi:unnamed protein product [Allacma fusca]|uniref:Histone-lysine N-methyltransferase n=1 Tax=Allacma fusca TaxID=39272 RepID=A0A8J2KS18_9HEXA|nr:unnamed protein product [Allacma fusca]
MSDSFYKVDPGMNTKYNMSSKNLRLSRAGSESSATSSSLVDSESLETSNESSPGKILLKSKSLSVPMESTANDSSDSSSSDKGQRSPSPLVPEDQYEVEKVCNYVKDESGEMYLVKWKNWEEEFNTWEPPRNLVNCDSALLEFYLARKKEYDSIINESEYVITDTGKKRRKGPRIYIQVPPDPRPYEVQVQEFFEVHGELTKAELEECMKKVGGKKKFDNRGWTGKLSKTLHEGIDGKLSEESLSSVRKQLAEFEYMRRRNEHNRILKEWQEHINNVSNGKPKITIENEVDWAGPPENFVYINDYVTSADISIPDDPPVGCNCSNGCYDNRLGCCAAAFGAKFAYSQAGRLRVPVGTPIYECNRKCKCDSSCPNRVVQDGQNSTMQFCIFRTSNGCGWGVKTLKAIKKGTFVTLYVGEVINTEEAERRGRSYDAEGCTYLFDLDFNEQEHCPYTVDAAKYGNIAHFINHSCDPNLGVFAVWVDCLDVNLPKLALFAIYDIPKGAELTFDYKNLVEERVSKDVSQFIDCSFRSNSYRRKGSQLTYWYFSAQQMR